MLYFSSLADHKITNQGFLFLGAPYCFHEVRQTTMPFPALVEDSLPIKGVRDRVRKKLERLGDNPTEEKSKGFFQELFRILGLDNFSKVMQETRYTVPEDMAHAGAWVAVHGIACGVCNGSTDSEKIQYMKFLKALAAIDRKLLVTQSDEDARYWSNLFFPWIDLSPDQSQRFHASTLLLWAALARLYFVSYLEQAIDTTSSNSYDLLRCSLPACKGNKLILSCDTAIQSLKNQLPQIADGTKPTYTNLAAMMDIDERTLRRIRCGECLLRYQHLHSIQVRDLLAFQDTFINIWTCRQKAMIEAEIPPEEIVEYFSHYDEIMERVSALFEGFKASGAIWPQQMN